MLREVARAGSFAGAAAVLHHTPSAVSQQIAALERGAGATLVERSTRGVTLTGRPQARDLPITPQPTRYIGAYLPQRHQPNPAAERLLAALRAHAEAIHRE